jgi:uncharacterized protein YecT (DUF1311 family)
MLLFLAFLAVIAPHQVYSQSQQELNQEARENFEKADAELNREYKKVIAGLPDEKAVELLRAAQRAWVAFRDADSISYADEMRDGSAAPLLLYGHKTQLTRDRIKHLKERFEMRE